MPAELRGKWRKSTFEPEGVENQDARSRARRSKYSFDLKNLVVKSRFRRWRKEGRSTYTAVSAHLSNTSAKRRDVTKQLSDQRRKVAEKNLADIIAGDCNTAVRRERGEANASFIEDAWEETLLFPSPDVVPMWGKMDNTVDCRGFVIRTRSVPNWPVARHGSLQTEDEEADEGS